MPAAARPHGNRATSSAPLLRICLIRITVGSKTLSFSLHLGPGIEPPFPIECDRSTGVVPRFVEPRDRNPRWLTQQFLHIILRHVSLQHSPLASVFCWGSAALRRSSSTK